MIIPDYDKDLYCVNYTKPEYVKKHWPDFYEYLQQIYPDDPLNVQLYMFYHDLPEHPKCACGKRLKYKSRKLGFTKFCSVKCSTNSPLTQEITAKTNEKKYGGTGFASKELLRKQHNTMQALYGIDNAMHSEQFKNKVKSTTFERYGVESVMQSKSIREKVMKTQTQLYGGTGMGAKSIREKIERTQTERYGAMGMGSEIIRQKARESNQKRYGVPYNGQRPEVIEKSMKSRALSIKRKYPIIKDIIWENGAKTYICHCTHPDTCNKCNGEFKIFNEQFYRRLKDGTELCTLLLPYQHPTQFNTSVEVFVKMVLDNLGVNYIQTCRNIITPKELDFYLPEYNLAIECNGCYWHSTLYKDNKYHLNKYLECQQAGVQLLSIWEDWVVNSPNIVKSIILNKLHKTKVSIGARKCILKEIPHKIASSFLLTNHIQGPCNASTHLGLYYHDELVSVMSFGSRRPSMGHESGCELLRFCNKINTNVQGAASKLLKHYIKQYNIKTVTSFSSNDISNGSLYERLGFEYVGMNPSYWYVGRDFKRYHRFTFCKSKLVKMGYDKTKTEKEIMSDLPYQCIYDSGQTKWVLNLDK